jgi:hypothetical protein
LGKTSVSRTSLTAFSVSSCAFIISPSK